MLTDAHCHPCDLLFVLPNAVQERINILSHNGENGVIAAASAWNADDFAYNEILARNAEKDGQAPLFQCFGIHPQLPAIYSEKGKQFKDADLTASMEFLYSAAENKKINALGEFGFDLFNDSFKETEKIQDKIFEAHLEAAINHGLPAVLHVRRAMHKIFLHAKNLCRCKAVIFHSWPGSYEEALSILKHGINAYFSFGNTILCNHKQAIRSCALLPSQRLLTETDAPFQPRRGEQFSNWKDLLPILETAAKLRTETGNNIGIKDLELQIEANFKNIFSFSTL